MTYGGGGSKPASLGGRFNCKKKKFAKESGDSEIGALGGVKDIQVSGGQRRFWLRNRGPLKEGVYVSGYMGKVSKKRAGALPAGGGEQEARNPCQNKEKNLVKEPMLGENTTIPGEGVVLKRFIEILGGRNAAGLPTPFVPRKSNHILYQRRF